VKFFEMIYQQIPVHGFPILLGDLAHSMTSEE